jgi:NAD(P)-dependent dehydrogenase (short-subunit alcohol dehydrogenase family)
MIDSIEGPHGPSFASLPDHYRAVVIGATGGIGSALCERLRADRRLGSLIGISRKNDGLDITDEASVAQAASRVTGLPIHFLICATGALTVSGVGPEKSLRQISAEIMLEQFRINAIGPALVAKHFLPLLDRRSRCLGAFLSARVGSIGDNRLGGWMSYRASKAALNQIVRTAAIEIGRTHPQSVVVAVHPGTVETALSKPYAAGHPIVSPSTAAGNILATLDGLGQNQSGSFVAYDGSTIVW